MAKVICPCCGSKQVKPKIRISRIRSAWGPYFTVKETIFKCFRCKEWGDFAQVNDGKVNLALSILKKKLVKKYLKNLNTYGYNPLALERVLHLRPFGMLKKTLDSEVPDSVVALLKIINDFPTLLGYIDNYYSLKK